MRISATLKNTSSSSVMVIRAGMLLEPRTDVKCEVATETPANGGVSVGLPAVLDAGESFIVTLVMRPSQAGVCAAMLVRLLLKSYAARARRGEQTADLPTSAAYSSSPSPSPPLLADARQVCHLRTVPRQSGSASGTQQVSGADFLVGHPVTLRSVSPADAGDQRIVGPSAPYQPAKRRHARPADAKHIEPGEPPPGPPPPVAFR